MYVCQCRAVSDRTVCEAIEAGARTPRQLAQACGAGAECRGCWPVLEELLEAASCRELVAAGPMLGGR